LESGLVKRLYEAVPEHFSSPKDRLGVVSELIVGKSIADLVLLVERGSTPAGLQRPLSVRESVVLSALRPRLKSDSAADQVASPESTDPAIATLLKVGALRTQRNGSIALGRVWDRPRRLVAIEAKLTRWRDALDQAIAYRRYADESYVALPEARIDGAYAGRSCFVAAGVGLIAVSRAGIRQLVPARPSAEHDWRRDFVLSRLMIRLVAPTGARE
jgi:hypothetical protein